MTNIALTKLLIKMLGKTESSIRYVADRPGHDLRYAIDCSKAEVELGWSPQYTFDRGIQETIDWYLSHQDWVARNRSGDYLKFYAEQYGKRLG